MKIITVEEHFLTEAVKEEWKKYSDEDNSARANVATTLNPHEGEIENRLEDMGATRLKLMDETGIDVQVLSLTSPSLHNLGSESVSLAKQTNDLVAEIVNKTPDRFQGFAALPMPVPKEAVKELERSVKKLGFKGAMVCGRTREKNFDHKDFWELFECAEALGVPLYIHPQIPQKAVRDAYYSGFDDDFLNIAFSTYGLGWHYESGIQFVRLVLSKVFDRFPHLQIMLGHWGEVILFYVERWASLSKTAKLDRPILDYVTQNLYVTASGMYDQTCLKRAVEIIGTDRIIFSSDYPFQYRPGRDARNFLEAADLKKEDKEKFAFANWERLTNVFPK